MKRLRIYIDTSIVGGCLDEEFTEESKLLIAMARKGEVCLLISDLLVQELREAPDAIRAILAELPDDTVERVSMTLETQHLRDAYLASEVVGERSSNDAHHVAIATVHRAAMIVSWNFRHIVHFDKIRQFNAVNLREGYGIMEIYSPKEVV